MHSFKDLPTRPREGLIVAAVCQRRWPEDCLLARKKIGSLDELDAGARVGTSSLRRAAQLRHLRPDLELVPVRGNVPTRIRKLRDADFDAQSSWRGPDWSDSDWTDAISFVFDPHQFLPAPPKGALAAETRSADATTNEIVATIDDADRRAATDAEREVL